MYFSCNGMKQCAEIAFSARQNAKNEHLHKDKNQIE
jgi:hypothetical protein